jgi:peroxiredoxin
MPPTKIQAGTLFPDIIVPNRDGNPAKLGEPAAGGDWQMLMVYRGVHCPICTNYLNTLETYKDRFAEIGVDIAAVSADSKALLEKHWQQLDVSFPIYHGLSVQQMQSLGLYVSNPRSEQETDHPFPEPGLLVVNQEGKVAVADIANNPTVRPDLERGVGGFAFIKAPENACPIRGTYD